MFCVDTHLLKLKIVEHNTTQEALAQSLEIDRSTLHRRLVSGTLRIRDIHKICEVLHLSNEECMQIFLRQQSQKCD